ncbi:GDSL-type esterase/lipase family protein [Kitasatospora phosalacinea]|uniref:GDSL-type esterase/lipase family protein n=1 Tax=Kitasatospora phosalacinea TaxID=2065 RepID=UPI00068ECE85|nr:GDSL-type esterase/lipase family protein [Kitasatospora phosalacinea]
MKRLTALAAICLLVATGTATTSAAAHAAISSATVSSTPHIVRVMPLGDSITWGVGSATGGSYRQPLAELTGQQSSYSIDFVGSMHNGPTADSENEGHSGYTIDQVRASVDRWLAMARPDVVLLHVGANDLDHGNRSGAADRTTELINQIFADRPGITVILQGLVPTSPGLNDQLTADQIAQYNNQLRQLAPIEQQQGKHFSFVDAPALVPFNAPSPEMADGLHPNDLGYARIARTFSTALEQAHGNGWFTGGAPVPQGPQTASAMTGHTVHLFRVTADGHIETNDGNYDAGAWNGWRQLPGSLVVSLSAAATGDTVHLYAVTQDGLLHTADQNYTTGTWTDWRYVPGSQIETITAAATGDTVHLYAVLRQNGVPRTADQNYTTGTWTDWHDLGGGQVSQLAAAVTRNTVHLYAVTQDGLLHTDDGDYTAGTWTGWHDLGGSLVTSLAAAGIDDTVHLYAGTQDGLFHTADGDYTTGRWNGWTTRPGSLVAHLAAATDRDSVHLFASTTDGLTHSQDADYSRSAWGGWYNL